MKIKRFEAASMSDALRMIKKEFGEEAVILSAKTHRKAGHIFGGKTEQVVVTAAVDAPDTGGPQDPGQSEASPYAGSELKTAAADSVRRTLWSRLQPITRTGQEKLKAKFVRLAAEPHAAPAEDPLNALQRRMIGQGVSRELATELLEKAGALLSSGRAAENELPKLLSQVLDAKGMAAPSGRTPRIIVLIGPCGVGKTTTTVKLAAEAALQGRRAAMISIDRQRVAGTEELERYARILGMSLLRAETPRELEPVLARLEGCDLLIVDTPGVGPNDASLRERLRMFLKRLEKAEVHLLISAAMADRGMQKVIEWFRPLAPHHLIYTQLDWAVTYGELLNAAAHAGLGVSFLSNSAQVSVSLQTVTAESLSNLLWPENSEPPENSGTNVAASITMLKATPNALKDGFVANRNSDIFHRLSCRAVKRISDLNTISFGNPDEARQQSYKPCRMCCSDLYTPKPIYRPVMVMSGSR